MLVRVLLANKFFYPRAGAETVFFQTRDLLQAHGHEVIDFACQSEANLPSPWEAYFAPAREYREKRGLPRVVRDAAAAIYSPAARRSLAALLDRVRPDVAHLHNVYHQLSLSVVDELADRGIPTVMTLHDYKIVCPSYTLFTNGAPCRRCVNGSVLNAIRHKCVHASRSASAVAAGEARLARIRGTYERLGAVVSPSRFLAGIAVAEISREKIHVVPNFIDSDERRPRAPRRGQPYVLFAGRLDHVKGVRVIMRAFEIDPPGVQLRIAGMGPLDDEVRAWARGRADARVLGQCSAEQVAEQMAGADALLVPSIWEENCPMSVLEARAAGLPVVCSDRGGLAELVDDGVDGLVVDVNEPAQLSAALRRLTSDASLRATLSAKGAARLKERHSPEQYYAGLMRAYGAAGAPA